MLGADAKVRIFFDQTVDSYPGLHGEVMRLLGQASDKKRRTSLLNFVAAAALITCWTELYADKFDFLQTIEFWRANPEVRTIIKTLKYLEKHE